MNNIKKQVEVNYKTLLKSLKEEVDKKVPVEDPVEHEIKAGRRPKWLKTV